MSKLIERLENVGQADSTPMGFGVARTVEKPSPLLLLAIGELKHAKALSKIKVDSVIITAQEANEKVLNSAGEMAGDVIWGVWPEAFANDVLKALKKKGGDFFAFSDLTAPAELLAGEGLGRVMVLPVDFPEELSHSLEEMPVDAILLAGLEEASPLSVRDLMQIRSVRDLTSKPILLLRSHLLSHGELAVLQEIGTQAIAADARIMKMEAMAQMREAIDSLPPRKVKREPATPFLPRVSTRAVLPGVAEEEEEEEEED